GRWAPLPGPALRSGAGRRGQALLELSRRVPDVGPVGVVGGIELVRRLEVGVGGFFVTEAGQVFAQLAVGGGQRLRLRPRLRSPDDLVRRERVGTVCTIGHPVAQGVEGSELLRRAQREDLLEGGREGGRQKRRCACVTTGRRG